MKIAMVGAGAVGGTLGFLLDEAGFDVTLIDVDRDKIASIRDEGLTVVMPDGESRTRKIKATTDPGEVGPVDLVQISVKGYHTTSAAELSRPLVRPGTYVLSLQNGLKNLARIVAVLPEAIAVGGVTAHSAMPLGRNVIKYNGGLGGISIGRYDGRDDPGLQRVVDVFNATGIATNVICGDVRIPIWRKLLANVSCNAVAALTGFTGRQLVEFPPTNELIRALAEETAEVASAQGFDFAELEHAGDFAIKALTGVGDNKISMLQDVEAGRRTEIETLNLAVVERGEAYGVDTPLNWMVGILVQALEQKMLFERQAAPPPPQDQPPPENPSASENPSPPENPSPATLPSSDATYQSTSDQGVSR